MTSRPRRVDSLTFAAFFTFGSGLGGPGFYQKKREKERVKGESNRWLSASVVLVVCLKTRVDDDQKINKLDVSYVS